MTFRKIFIVYLVSLIIFFYSTLFLFSVAPTFNFDELRSSSDTSFIMLLFAPIIVPIFDGLSGSLELSSIVIALSLPSSLPLIYQLVSLKRRRVIDTKYGANIIVLNVIGSSVLLLVGLVHQLSLAESLSFYWKDTSYVSVFFLLFLSNFLGLVSWTLIYTFWGGLIVMRHRGDGVSETTVRKKLWGVFFLALFTLLATTAIIYVFVVRGLPTYHKAMSGSDYTKCEEIDKTLISLRDSCFEHFAIQMEDLSICRFGTSYSCHREVMKYDSNWQKCDMMPSDSFRDDCYEAAVETFPVSKDNNICEFIRSDSGYENSHCYTKLALTESDPSYCMNIQSQYSGSNRREECLRRVEMISEVRNKNWRFCISKDRPRSDDFYNCYRYFIPDFPNGEVCDYLTTSISTSEHPIHHIGGNCYYFLANYTRERKWCDRIPDGSAVNYCKQRIDSRNFEPLPDFTDSLRGEHSKETLYEKVRDQQ